MARYALTQSLSQCVYLPTQLRTLVTNGHDDEKIDGLIKFIDNHFLLGRGLGRQVIIDVAVTGVDGQSKASDEAAERPLQVRYDQKMAKYSRVAEQNNLRFIPAVFSHIGQIYGELKALVKEQIRHKLIAFEREATSSKIRSVMKWWSKYISMAIAKTASRNVAFKVAKMRKSIMEDQDEFIIRKSDSEELGFEANNNNINKAALEDVGLGRRA